MLLLFVRHGESAFNAQGKLAGQADVPLSEHGRAQVQALAPLVQSYMPDRVLSSDLLRTRQTAELLGYEQAACAPGWREMDLGDWTSADVAALQAENADQYAGWRAGEFTPPGGECWADFVARIDGALAAARLEDGERLLISTHGGVIRAVCSLLVDLPPRRIVPVSPASLTVFECGDSPRLVAYNTGATKRAIEAHI